MDAYELYHKRCRLCASEHRLGINIFGNEGVSLDLKCKIKTYLSMDVCTEDELPKQVCYQCLYRIETFHNFKRSCVEAEHTLKNWDFFCGGIPAANNSLENVEASSPAESDSSRISVESVAQPMICSLSDSTKSPLSKKDKQIQLHKKKNVSPKNGKVDVMAAKNCRNVLRISGDNEDEEENSEVSRILLNMSGVGTIAVTKYEGNHEEDQYSRQKENEEGTQGETEEYVISRLDEEDDDDDEDEGGFSGFDFDETLPIETSDEIMKEEMLVGELVESVKFEHLEVDQNGKVTPVESDQIQEKNYYKYMMVELESPTGPRYGCLKCNKTFSQKGYMKEHFKIHTGEKPYACSVCGRCFRNNYMLKVHFRLHTGEKNFKCEVCGAMFTERGALISHSRTHTGDKPFACTYCDRRFTQNPALKRHLRIHTKEKPYVCDVCETSFADRGTWRNHMRIHTGERPFECNLCGKSFIQRTNLQAHIKTHTDERPFPCHVCDSAFRTKAHLIKHLSTIHRDVMTSVANFFKDPADKKLPVTKVKS